MSDENNNFNDVVAIIAKNEGIVDYVTEIKSGAMKGDNYLGVITAIDIKGTDGKNGTEKALSVIAKSALTNEKLRKEIYVDQIYGREIYMYDQFFHAYEKIQKEKRVQDPFTSYPKCYYTSKEPMREVLILENLKTKNYQLWDRNFPMDEQHVEMVLKEYGKFHATWLALKEIDPIKYEDIVANMTNLFADDMDRMSVIMLPHFDNTIALYDQNTEKDTIDYLKTIKDGLMDYYKGLLDTPDNIVVLHGDCWCNNMLFKYEDLENPTKPTKMAFLDFQACRMGSPVHDLAYYFYACGSKSCFDKLDHFKKIYYDSFAKHLRSLDCDPDEIFSHEQFEEHWRRHAKMGLAIAFLIIRVMISDTSEAPDMAKAAEEGKDVFEAFSYKSSKEDEYNRRIKDIIQHMKENQFY